MDNWLGAHYKYDGNKENVPIVMGYYEEEDIPFHRALASAFTICDRYHCSMLGPTGPNRFYWETGMIDPNGLGGGPMLSNEGFVHRWKTYAEYLTEAGVSWKHYHMKGGMKSQANWCEGFQNLTEASPLFHPSQPVEEGQFEYDALHDRLPTVSCSIRTHTKTSILPNPQSPQERVSLPRSWRPLRLILRYGPRRSLSLSMTRMMVCSTMSHLRLRCLVHQMSS